jgi:hypothetical protein
MRGTVAGSILGGGERSYHGLKRFCKSKMAISCCSQVACGSSIRAAMSVCSAWRSWSSVDGSCRVR